MEVVFRLQCTDAGLWLASVNAADQSGRSAVHMASMEGHVDVDPRRGCGGSLADHSGSSAVHMASMEGHVGPRGQVSPEAFFVCDQSQTPAAKNVQPADRSTSSFVC